MIINAQDEKKGAKQHYLVEPWDNSIVDWKPLMEIDVYGWRMDNSQSSSVIPEVHNLAHWCLKSTIWTVVQGETNSNTFYIRESL